MNVTTRPLLVFSAALLIAVPAAAQRSAAGNADQPPTQKTNTGGSTDIGEIVVTATRQSQAISRVPISVTAITQANLDAQGIRNFDDVTRFTPGLTLNRNGFGTQASVSIRGIDSNIGAGTVGVYVDDTPIQTRSIGYSSTNLYPQLFDLERVEVLRGPQGTLFGAGSEGGTVRFITPQPNLNDVQAYARGEIGMIDGGGTSYEGGAAINLPVVDDKLAIRASLSHRRDGGWIDRVDQFTDTVRNRNSNKQDGTVARVAATWAPTETLKITPSFLYQNTKLRDVYTYWDALSDAGDQKFRNGQILRQPDHDRYILPALRVELNGAGFDVISNTSYFRRHHTAVDDYSNLIAGIYFDENTVPGLPGYISYANMDNRYRSFTQELRVQSQDPDARFTWILGVFYNRLKQHAYEEIVDPDFGDVFAQFGSTVEESTGQALIDGTYSLIGNFKTTDGQIAGFGEASYEIVDGLRARVGLRYSDSRYSSTNFVTGPFNYGTASDSGKGGEKPLTPKFNLSWQIDRANLVYATASKGFRVGGVNPTIPTGICGTDLTQRGYMNAPSSYASDSLWSYELGTKNRLFGGMTQIAASVFHIDWKNIQRNVYLGGCALQFTDNLGSAKSDGFDLQVSQRLGSALTLTAAVGYTDSRFSESILGGLVRGSTTERRVLVRKGNALQSQPWTVVLGGQYDFKVASQGGYLRADYNFRGGNKLTAERDPTTSSFNANALEPDETNTVNARLGTVVRNIDLSLFANNLLNDHPRLSHYAEGGDPIFRETTITPRTIGLTASYRY